MGTIAFDSQGLPIKPNFPLVTKEDIKAGYRYLLDDLSNINNFAILCQNLQDHVEYLLKQFQNLLKMQRKKIETFTIGKTYAKTKKQYRHNFNGAFSNNFTVEGISDRFRNFYEPQGYDFLVGIVIITRQNVPRNAAQAFRNQQMLTLSLESQLIQHFSYVKCDNRLGNTSLYPGHNSKPHAGGVIYLAVKTC